MCNVISILFVIFVTHVSLDSINYNKQQEQNLYKFLAKINNRE